jgi:nucleoside-diphosphate-sugar epimerase
MKVLVTGGAGFIGSNLTMHLLGYSHEVTVFDNFSSGYARNIDALPGVDFVQGDVRDEDSVRQVTAGRNIVFHVAAGAGNKRSINDPHSDAEINVIGTLRVLEAARKAGVRKLVISSSAGILGNRRGCPFVKIIPRNPTHLGASKVCPEKQRLAYAKLYGMEVVSLRYFNGYGTSQRFDAYGNVIPIFVFQMLRGEPVTIFGDGEQTRDFVNVRDVVQANIKPAMVPGGTNDLVERLRAASGLNQGVRHGPPRAGDERDSLADICPARKAFGLEPAVTIDGGLPEYIRWARAEMAS